MCLNEKRQVLNLTSLAESENIVLLDDFFFFLRTNLSWKRTGQISSLNSVLFNYYFINVVRAARNSLIGPIVSTGPLWFSFIFINKFF